MRGASPLAREAALATTSAGLLAAVLAWAGPPGSDLAAHVYQRALFLHHGFILWNNFWYAGHYSFVSYSVLYYPLAALLGIRVLAVATIAAAALAFAVVVGREWGPASRWSSRTFAVVWAGVVLSAAFPFALGAALALLSLWALQARNRPAVACFAALTALASPVAFLLLVLVLLGLVIGRKADDWPRHAPVALALALIGAVEVLLWRAFPAGGRFPFSLAELASSLTFCAFGTGLTWRVERAQLLRFVFVVYAVACTTAYLVPSPVGENIARLRFAAIPVTVLVLSLRRWRPRFVALVALGLATAWNVSPLAANFVKGDTDPAAHAAYWQPAISFLHDHLTPSYRVEAVDTTGHWDALYLPRAGIPLVRGWFRQDDFPQNALLYQRPRPAPYLAWLRRLAVRYVVLTNAPPDYSARAEAALVAGPHSPLRRVFHRRGITVYAVPHPRPIVRGPGRARVVALTQSRVVLHVDRPGQYAIDIRYSPYWQPTAGCLSKGRGGVLRLVTRRSGTVALDFRVDAARALRAVTGGDAHACSG